MLCCQDSGAYGTSSKSLAAMVILAAWLNVEVVPCRFVVCFLVAVHRIHDKVAGLGAALAAVAVLRSRKK